MVSALISRLVVLFVGTLYPAYGSYKAIRSKNPREYVNWIMYWICFALFTFCETFADIFLSFCIPFYYELKVLFLAWLLCPATRGSAILYKNFVHPRLLKHENEIDEMISNAKESGVSAVYQLGTKGAKYASQLLTSTAIKGHQVFLQQLQRSYSQGDVARAALLAPEDEQQLQVQRRKVNAKSTGNLRRREVVSVPAFSDEELDDDDDFQIIEEHDAMEEMDPDRHEPEQPPKLPSKKKGKDGQKSKKGRTVYFESDSGSSSESDGVNDFSEDLEDEDYTVASSSRKRSDEREPESKPLTRARRVAVVKRSQAVTSKTNNNNNNDGKAVR